MKTHDGSGRGRELAADDGCAEGGRGAEERARGERGGHDRGEVKAGDGGWQASGARWLLASFESSLARPAAACTCRRVGGTASCARPLDRQAKPIDPSPAGLLLLPPYNGSYDRG